MRSLFVAIAAAALLATAASATERRIFIITGNADGYGVDRCLADGATCGAAAASAYCKAREYEHAASYRKVDRDEITGAVPVTSPACRGSTCDEFVAIVCTR